MSTFTRPPRRGRHVDLPTHQRRARHLRSISARSLAIRGTRGLLVSYFTLHNPQHPDSELYRSEIIKNSLNPSWKSFELGPQDGIQPSFSSVIIRVWVSDSQAALRNMELAARLQTFRLAIEWNVDLLALVYGGEHLFDERIPRDSNTLVFGMFEGYYVAPLGGEKLSQRALAATLYTPSIVVEKESVRLTYSDGLLGQFNALQRRVACKKLAVHEVQETINQNGRDQAERHMLVSQCETSRCGVAVMDEQLNRQQQCLMHERQVLEDTRSRLREKAAQLAANLQDLARRQQDLRESRRHLKNRRKLAFRTGTCLQARRCMMLRDLSSIYQIVEQSKNGHSIVGVRVPHSEALPTQSDEALSVGFGYAAHLVYHIALILHLPLRYSIIPRGSRSMLKDSISDASVLQDNRGLCNLFPRQRADKDSYFQYALFLLNKNITQVRFYCDLNTLDGRLTLKNIKTLLDRFSVMGDRLHSHSVHPTACSENDSDTVDTVDGLPRPTRTFSVIPSFKGQSPRAAPSWIPMGTTPSPPAVDTQPAYGHRRQHSEPLSPSTILISADECSQTPLSAGASPNLSLNHPPHVHALAADNDDN